MSIRVTWSLHNLLAQFKWFQYISRIPIKRQFGYTTENTASVFCTSFRTDAFADFLKDLKCLKQAKIVPKMFSPLWKAAVLLKLLCKI